ncbi:hypothetical protein R8Z50_22475 [Longispora sp. K20-0274]|uniref:hypothetical protein n=1 Tax=Longispora sp. K20-0274 TaxID=3088255 RepID=UPI00399A776D
MASWLDAAGPLGIDGELTIPYPTSLDDTITILLAAAGWPANPTTGPIPASQPAPTTDRGADLKPTQ